MFFKCLKHFYIFIKVEIPLKKLVLLKYIRKKLDFLLPIGFSSYTRVLKKNLGKVKNYITIIRISNNILYNYSYKKVYYTP